MDTFVCLLFDSDGAIVATTTVNAYAVDEADRKGTALLHDTPDAVGLELWRRGDKVWTTLLQGDEDATS